MANLPGPYAVQYLYQVGALTHEINLNCVVTGNPTPGTPMASIIFATKSGGTVAASTGVTNFWNLIRGVLNTAVTNIGVNLWKYIPGTENRDFVSAMPSPLLGGALANATVVAGEAIWTWRTVNGSYMRLCLQQPILAGNTITAIAANASGNAQERIAAYPLSSEGWCIGADDSYPHSTMSLALGQNEATWRKLFRP